MAKTISLRRNAVNDITFYRPFLTQSLTFFFRTLFVYRIPFFTIVLSSCTTIVIGHGVVVKTSSSLYCTKVCSAFHTHKKAYETFFCYEILSGHCITKSYRNIKIFCTLILLLSLFCFLCSVLLISCQTKGKCRRWNVKSNLQIYHSNDVNKIIKNACCCSQQEKKNLL